MQVTAAPVPPQSLAAVRPGDVVTFRRPTRKLPLRIRVESTREPYNVENRAMGLRWLDGTYLTEAGTPAYHQHHGAALLEPRDIVKIERPASA